MTAEAQRHATPRSAAEERRQVAEVKPNIVNVPQASYRIVRREFDILSTVLGSCVAVCIRDPATGMGGMNHFLLPRPATGFRELNSSAMRYGSYAIERMVNKLIAAGANRQALEFKAFGGANMFGGTAQIGWRNADFVEEYLTAEGFRILASDLRGNVARKVRFQPSTGKAWVKQLGREYRNPFIVEESVALPQPPSEVELF